MVTATLAVVFVGGVLGLQASLAQFTGGNTIAVAAATLVVAALFQPLRAASSASSIAASTAPAMTRAYRRSLLRRLRDEVDLERPDGAGGDRG
jgi:hypothetical protein